MAFALLTRSIIVLVAMHGMFALSATVCPTVDIATAIPGATIDNSFAAWGQFCNDLSCKDCGNWVDLSNSGCLQETDRQAVNIKTNGPHPLVALVYTPDDQCSCQSECDAISGTGCWELNATVTQSYRFVNFGDLGSVCSNTHKNC